ncbi:hypothetical protein F4810DRAFT_695052 [Camillea tinctor]|nr:hypothetical protein F4810DRAFT_695052 [Camillea tinctor]
MGSLAPRTPPTESFAVRRGRAQDAISSAIAQEKINRGVLTGIRVCDLTDMEHLTKDDIKSFGEIISHYSKNDNLTPDGVLVSLRAILSKANKSWGEYTRENGQANYDENKAVFWYMYWEKHCSKKNFTFADHSSLMKLVEYYLTGFHNLLKKGKIRWNPNSKECACVCRMTQWLQATQGIHVILSASINCVDYPRKRQRTNSEGEQVPQHDTVRPQTQGLEHELEKMTAARDEAIEKYGDISHELDHVKSELQLEKEKYQKSELRCSILCDQLSELRNEKEPIELDMDEILQDDLSDSSGSEDESELTKAALKVVLHSTTGENQTAYLAQIKRFKDVGSLDASMMDHYKHCLEEMVACDTLSDDAKARCAALLEDWN